jgi:twitching motility two-component system response regulator PilG
MQGNLTEIDMRSILQLIELGQRTGELFVQAYNPPGNAAIKGSDRQRRSDQQQQEQSWFVFFNNGQIIYATSDSDSNISRLRDYLRRYKAENALDNLETPATPSTNAPEYGYLWALLENRIITPSQGRSIIHSMINETLFDLLDLHNGSFIFEMGAPLAPQLTTLEISNYVPKIVQRIQEWKQFHPHIQSPNQCPIITDLEKLRETLPEPTFNTLTRWADGLTTIRTLARYLNRDVLTVARAIHPYVQQGLVQLTGPFNQNERHNAWSLFPSKPTKVPRIVCIDDEVAVRKSVEYILSQHGYEASGISNPVKALSLVFQLKPDLILCDITMPLLDGYEICAMLRRSTAFRQTPICMITGKDGFIDRVKARMVGSTDYLTKPFGESELLMLVEKYAGPGDPTQPAPNKLLEDALEAELDLDMDDTYTPATPFN